MAVKQQIYPALASRAASTIYDALEIVRNLKGIEPEGAKDLLLIRSRLADALIDLHKAGATCPSPFPKDPRAKKTNQS